MKTIAEAILELDGTGGGSGGGAGGGGGMIVTVTTYNNVIDDAQIDKTFNEIEQAILAGNIVTLRQKNYIDSTLIGIYDFQFVGLTPIPETNVEFGVTTVVTGHPILNNAVIYAGFRINSNNELSAINNIYPSNQPIG